jgi:hypothetical protein
LNNRLLCCVVAVVIGDYIENSLENVLISAVLEMQCELVRLFVSNRQDACLSGCSGSINKERNKPKPRNVVNNL